MVVARIWRGVTLKSKSSRHLRYLEETGVRDYKRTPGFLGVTILTRDEGDETEFVMISLWKSKDAVKRYAGDDIEKARFYPRDREFLLDPEAKVRHYRVASQLK